MAKKKMTLEEKMEEAIVMDVPYEVPRNWVCSKLGAVCNKVQYGYTEKASIEKLGPHFLRITDIQENEVDWDSVPYCPISKKDYTKYKLDKGDIVIARTGATTGKNYIISDEVDAVFASYLIRMKISDSIYNKFISYYMYSDLYWKQIMEEKKGIAQPGVNAQKLGSLIVPIPPLKEQQRIVDRIESLFEKLDKAKELIEEAREEFENRKAAILEKAFRGELTKSKMRECLLKDYITTQYGYTASSKLEKADSKYLRITDIKEDYVDWINVPYCEINQKHKEKYLLFKNDIVIARTGATTGKSYLINEDVEAVFASYLIRLRIMNKNILPEYLYKFLKSNIYWKQIMELRKGIAQPGVNAEKLKKVIIPLPEIEEQKEIVRILDKLLQDESKIEELTALEDQIELIKKSILAKAFRSELGTNDPNEESALELLKEILSKE
ncbi:restriction endonuclease [Clostridium botulinum]|nr:restriction endonuclease [Clostridium botulinum]NFI19023.1 restriction endonuclease [Clostridium botulinum]NFL93994.1 restriction endonuclease [Clostridium botulinum]NFN53616.1 restriction endonuclease [Clostridium botulinum]NFO28526.1 restriction endonuclease [Clostridium botulinum]